MAELNFDSLFDDDFFDELEKGVVVRGDTPGSVKQSIDTTNKLAHVVTSDMSSEEIETFQKSDDYREYKADIVEAVDKKANYKGKTVQEVMGLEDRRNALGYSYNALEHYDIDLDIYRDIVDQSPVMQETLREGEEILPIFKYLHEDIFLSLLKYKAVVVPETNMHISTRMNRQIISKLINTPEYISLRKTCRLDQFNAALGTEIMGQQALEIIREMIENIKNLQQKKDAMDELLEKEQQIDELIEENENIDELLEQAKQQGDGQAVSSLQSQKEANEQAISQTKALANKIAEECDELINDDDMIEDIVNVMGRALTETDKQVGEVSDLCEAWGLSSGGTSNVAFQNKKDAIEIIRRSKKLKKLTDLIGRFKESAISEQKKKAKDGAVEIKSVTTGNKIQDALPSEKINLINDATKKDFYRRMSENQLMTYKKESNKTKNKGPIIVCVDTSGSMGETEEMWSKALTIGILEVAQLQKRDFACIIYSGSADEPIIIKKDEIAPQKIIECAERYHGGGTNFENPLKESLKLLKQSEFHDADIVFITDGDCGVSDEFMKKFKAAKEDKEFKTKGILVNMGHGHSSRSTLDEFCDDVVLMSSVADLQNADSDANKNIFGNL